MSTMDFYEVTHYLATMFKEYGQRMNYKPVPDPRSFEVNCEDDLWRHYNIHGELLVHLTEDNTTCLFPPDPRVSIPDFDFQKWIS